MKNAQKRLQNSDRPGANFYYKNPAQHECVQDNMKKR
jgi:hypothetical protein